MAHAIKIYTVTQGGVKALEQLLDGACLGQTLVEQPDRFGIRHTARQSQTKETHKKTGDR
ncbi:hypothetical protein Gbfr_065_002 [Gluconobacter frateurii M-2]|nr:hypothetical protein Gbfr_065_002 [Gluconobacter frateurii M-2]